MVDTLEIGGHAILPYTEKALALALVFVSPLPW